MGSRLFTPFCCQTELTMRLLPTASYHPPPPPLGYHVDCGPLHVVGQRATGSDTFCAGKPDGNYANPSSCSSFFTCVNGNKYITNCGAGTP